MTVLAKQIGQLLMVGFQGHTPPLDLETRIRDSEIGGVILFAPNVASLPQVKTLCDALSGVAITSVSGFEPSPLLIAIDQEGGRVQRIKTPATVFPPMAALGKLSPDEGDRAAYDVGTALAAELSQLGVHCNYAPVLDVHSNPENPVIGDRAYSTEPARVAALGIAMARGLAAGGVLPCGKHFPGHGDTLLDSHLALPQVDHPIERISRVELEPFRRAIAADSLPLIMTAHVVFSALDPGLPATWSRKTVHTLLRGELGFRGVIASDDLEMKAICAEVGVGEAGARALIAGCDQLLIRERESAPGELFTAILRLAEKSALLRERIAESAARVSLMKRAWCPHPNAAKFSHEPIGGPAHQAIAQRLKEALTA